MDIAQKALELHKKLRGKIRIQPTYDIQALEDLTLVYSPGVGAVAKAIAADPSLVKEYTWKQNTVAIVSDGTAVLGFGDIGPDAVMPVLEGKSAIFKRFSGIDAVPIALSTKDPKRIIEAVEAIAPSFGAIQLEDIAAPACFEIERELSERLSIPVMHDDQHGTAIVVLAGLLNAIKVAKKDMGGIRVVMNGAGAAGIAIARLLTKAGVTDLVMCDRQGAIVEGRDDMNSEKAEIATFTNRQKHSGTLAEVVSGADVLIGVSAAGSFTAEMVKRMNPNAIVFALANPVPEIMPEEAKAAGALVVATGRSDFANQVNNALCYPGLFRGMLDTGVNKVTDEMKIRAAEAIAGFVSEPSNERVIPTMFEQGLHEAVARSVQP
ncbi:MAG: NADP-dependent malic enzyme [Patescibacteria group bacterium]